jgi:hypothetical protein
MIQPFRLLNALLLPSLTVAGIVIGFYVPLRLFGSRPGFTGGVVICSIFTLLGSAGGALLFGGWGEEYLGITWGVPIGIGVGSLIVSTLLNLLAGFSGNVLSVLFQS